MVPRWKQFEIPPRSFKLPDTTHTYITGSAIIKDPVGLHARPAVKVTKLAKTFSSVVEISVQAPEKWVNAKSPSAVMKMKANFDDSLLIRASGDDAQAAVDAISALVVANFEG